MRKVRRRWFSELFGTRSEKPADQRPQARPRLELLEDRLPPGDLMGVGLLGTGSARPTATRPATPVAAAAPRAATGSNTHIVTTSSITPVSGTTQSSAELVRQTNSARQGGATLVTPVVATPPTGTATPRGATGVVAPSASGSLTDIRDDAARSVLNGLTNDATPTVFGTGPANKSVNVYTNGALAGTVQANAQGKWSLPLRRPLADGTHTVTVKTVGSAATTGSGKVTVDTKAPVVTLAATEYATKTDPARVTVAASDANLAGATAAIDVDLNKNGVFQGANEVGVKTGPLGTIILGDLPAGSIRVRARVTDNAGNVGISPTRVVFSDPSAGYVGHQPLRDFGGMAPLGGYGAGKPAGPVGPTGPVLGGSLTPDGKGGAGQPTNPALYTFDAAGRVLADIRYTQAKHAATFKNGLAALGATVTHTNLKSQLYTAWLPTTSIPLLESMKYFSAATAIPKPVLRTGSVTTEGDAVILGPDFRAQNNVDGTGIKIGVLSDSVSQLAGGLADSVGTGDLPATVQVLQDGSAGDTDEGRAMLEIIHDIAPGSDLAFHTAFGGPNGFADGIRALAAAGCLVITDDVGYSNSPMFSGGRIGQAVDEVAAQGVFYTSAAGNSGDIGWNGAWTSRTQTIDSVSNGTWMDFGGTALQPFTLADNEQVGIKYNWDAAYLEGGDPAANFQVPNNLDIYIVDTSSNSIVASTNTDNVNTDEAYELLQYTNNTGQTAFAFAFRLTSGPAPVYSGWLNYQSDPSFDSGTTGQTIYGQPLAAGSFASGAVAAATPDTPESFTSYGGQVPIYSDNTGARLAQPELRQKPDAAAPDGVVNSFFSPDGSGGFRFFGTSAATPHVAAAAALLLQQSGASSAEIFGHLVATAVDVAPNGVDPLTGTGRIQLVPYTGGGIGIGIGPGALEMNETSSSAYNFGAVSSWSYSGLTVGSYAGLPDYDWFVGTSAAGGTFTASVTNDQLQVRLFTETNGFLTPVASGTYVSAGTLVYVEVKGVQTAPGVFAQGDYDLAITC